MIFVTGDTHCPYDIAKLNIENFPEQKQLTKKDYVIICGDFGAVWRPEGVKGYREDKYWQEWFSNKTFTTLFVDGNHENHKLLAELPTENMFGGRVGKVCDSVYHLRRGEIYTIEDKTFFCFGGARSVDKHLRKENVDWWSEEMPSSMELNYAVDNLTFHKDTVDYMITHCCGSDTLTKLNRYYETDELTQFFKFLGSYIQFKHWYFGHYHEDKQVDDKHTCLYNNVEKLG